MKDFDEVLGPIKPALEKNLDRWGQDGGVDGGGEVQEDEGAEQQGQPGLQGEEEEEAGGGGAGVDQLAGEEHPPAGRVQEHAGRGGAGVDQLAGEDHPPAGRVQEHAGRGGPVQEKDPGAGFRSEKLKYYRSR